MNDRSHGVTGPAGRGVLLVNLGSPTTPDVADVRRYLREFLMDPRVLDMPYLLRSLLVNLLVVPFRAKKSAKAYRLIWTPEGSPLLVNCRKVLAGVRKLVNLPVALAMSYQTPTIGEVLGDLLKRLDGPKREVFLIPMFPHYAMSTYETVVEAVREALSKLDPAVTLTVMPPYYDRPEYIDALVAAAEESLHSEYDHLLFSFHGLPKRHLRKTDPTGGHCLTGPDCCLTPSPAHATCYRAQVLATAKEFVARTAIPEGKFSVAFQSRFGRDKWLDPMTDAEIVRLANQGVRRLLVICPAFVADCLETLEEIGIRGRDAFIAAGGVELKLVPCLNDHPRWIAALSQWCASIPAADGRSA